MAQDVYIAPPPPRSSRNWSCCLWGCLIAFVFTVLIAIAAALVVRSLATSFRENYTTAEPQQLPTVDIDEPALDELVTRVDAFADNVETNTPAHALVLRQDELNALIQHHPDWQGLHDKVYVKIEDGRVHGMVNFPLDVIPMMSGRYIHGTATFDIGLEDGRLEVYVDSAEVNGEPLPEEIMTAIRQENLAQEYMRDNPHAREVIDQLESITIEEDTLVIVPKLQAAEEVPLPVEAGGDIAPTMEPPLPAEAEGDIAPLDDDTAAESAPVEQTDEIEAAPAP